jgi:MYXO-CTERM domain-containing protein
MDLPPVIDVEHRPSGWTQTQMRNAIRTWIERVEQFGVEPIVYSGRYFWRDYVGSSEWSDHPFWIAHYTNGCPNIPDQWADWDFWQFTDKGSVSGVSGNTDVNEFNGTLQMLQALRPDGGGGVEPPPACGWIAADVATAVDDADACFSLHGPDQYWRSLDAGHDGGMSWTRSTSGTEYNYGIWELNFDEGGSYTVQVFADDAHTEATVAKYAVSHATGTSTVSVDQTDGGWIDVGTFEFDAGQSGQQIRLSDRTGQSGRQLAFDAIRLVPEGVDVGDEDCGEAPHPSPRTDAPIDVTDPHDRGAALGCRSGGTPMSALWLLLLLLPLRRRQRRED